MASSNWWKQAPGVVPTISECSHGKDTPIDCPACLLQAVECVLGMCTHTHYMGPKAPPDWVRDA